MLTIFYSIYYFTIRFIFTIFFSFLTKLDKNGDKTNKTRHTYINKKYNTSESNMLPKITTLTNKILIVDIDLS